MKEYVNQCIKAFKKYSDIYEEYIVEELFMLDRHRYPDVYKAMEAFYYTVYTPSHYKDKALQEELIKSRGEFFGENHPLAEMCSIADLIKHISINLGDRYNTDPVDFIRLFISNLAATRADKHHIATLAYRISTNSHFFYSEGGKYRWYSMFGLYSDDVRTSVNKQLKEFITCIDTDRYDNLLVRDHSILDEFRKRIC